MEGAATQGERNGGSVWGSVSLAGILQQARVEENGCFPGRREPRWEVACLEVFEGENGSPEALASKRKRVDGTVFFRVES